MKKSKRLQLVLQLAERRKRDADQALGRAQQRVAAEQQKLLQLESYLREYQQGALDAGRQGIAAEQLLRTQGFLARLAQAIETQKQQIRLAEQQLEQVKQQWRQARGREQAMGGLVERIAAQENLEEEKRLQKAIDELSQRRPGMLD